MATKKMQSGGKTGAQLKKEGQAMKAKGQAMKKLGKASISPAKSGYDEADTRFRASLIKNHESGGIFGPAAGAGSKNRTVEEQKTLDKDMAIARSKVAASKIRSQKEAKERKTVAGMQAKGSYKGNYKTGGMVNSNAKVSAIKTAGSKGVKSGVNPKASASNVAKGRVGGTSSAPKSAVPKAKMGMSMKGKKAC
jgi:hypothetical protein